MAAPSKYKQTLHLPDTTFPRHVKLAERETNLLEEWTSADLYNQVLEARKDSPSFLLHDGPPYSNGHIHYGHILNKILKDIVVKYKAMTGFRAPFIPGWDTHGLPIELAVDKKLKKKKRDMSVAEIRKACQDYAKDFVEIQKSEFQRLGIFGHWDAPYLTLQPQYEAAIVRSLAAFAKGGYIHRGKKPVHWSPKARTALAESEIEYHDHTSPSIYVRFPLDKEFVPSTLHPDLSGTSLALAIWTTTPWTLPSNLAIVLHQKFSYVAIQNTLVPGEHVIVAKDLAEKFCDSTRIDKASLDTAIDISKESLIQLEGVQYHHPFIPSPPTENAFRIWFADYVTLEQGTGLVHTAPGHGADDYKTGLAHDLPLLAPIDDAGRFTEDVPEWQGKNVFVANPEIVDKLFQDGFLLNSPGDSIDHSYPYCWRTKGPVIFRATPQWFIGIDTKDLRKRTLAEIQRTEWIPTWGENRIRGMIENRPDWCLSRQRLWGVPIPAFFCPCGEVQASAEMMDHVASIFEKSGADAWYTLPAEELVPANSTCSACGKLPAEWTPGKDIIDVWFESGCSWAALQNRVADPIDLYLEGSDQHRGWFHSSLLIGLGVTGQAPFRSVLTHGFVLDENGRPYSKSTIEEARRQGKKIRYVAPDEVIKKHGAEMLRLWVGSTDFTNDIPYSETMLDGLANWYKKFRATCWYMLGNLQTYDVEKHSLHKVDLSTLDRCILAKLGDVTARIRSAYERFEFHQVHRCLVDFVTSDLSAQYLDICKDSLYLDKADSPRRRAIQAVLYNTLRTIAQLGAPIMSFTAEEIWKALPKQPSDASSVHLMLLPEGLAQDETTQDYADWQTLYSYRELALKELEEFRKQKHKSEDAMVTIQPKKEDRSCLAKHTSLLADMMIVSGVSISEDNANPPTISVNQHTGAKCERCWKWFQNLPTDVCHRCNDAMADIAGRD